MYKILNKEQLDIIKKELPDARLHDKGNGNYKIRGVPEEKIDNLLKYKYNIVKIEEKNMAEPEKLKVESAGMGFSGLMLQAAGALEADMVRIKQDMLDKSKKLEADMEATRVKLEADAKQKLESLGRTVEEKSKAQDIKIDVAIKDIKQSFENYKSVTDAKAERIDKEVSGIKTKLIKVGEIYRN
uniref:Uncharacterized protein n=1 Tax=viral metagenome TaxID=1070528 RepID=A0A6H1ZFS7_9ZZZZ